MAAECVIECDDVCFAYGLQEVIHNASLKVHEREMVAIVGPNGGGKTTLLRLMLGLLTPQRGRIRLFGAAPRPVRTRVGYVPQQVHFDGKFPVTALEVVAMGRIEKHRFGPYRRADRAAAMTALTEVGMESCARRPFAALSGGERQRVLVAQALVSQPDLLLMDEPTASVDATVERQLFQLFHRLNQTHTIVLVSHNLNVVTEHASHVVCVNRTAEMHPIEEVRSGVFSSGGGDMAMLSHDMRCHVIDASGAMRAPHRAEQGASDDD